MTSYTENQLNFDYTPEFYTQSDADKIFNELLELPFQTLTLQISGKQYTPNRKVLAFGDDGLSYEFSGASVETHPWCPLLQKLRDDVQKVTSQQFNYVLLNYYPDGTSKIGHHKDNESSLDPSVPICVLSFGAQRSIEFKRPNCDMVSIQLAHGSLYQMKHPTNKLFTHGIPAEPDVKESRISVTFRKLVPSTRKRKLNSITTPAQKKSNVEDSFIPSGDWLEQLYEERNSLLSWWSLEYGMFILLYCDKEKGIRLHIRECNYINEYEWFPTKRGILMLPQTWAELSEKL